MRIRRALISVSDKGGVVDFARGLVALDVELISTGGTARLLERSGLRVTPVSALTGFPEILGGRVKTLHPAVFGGLLARREPAHLEELAAHRIGPIDLVAVTLYPFEETVAREGVTVGEAMEEIDIGGVSLLRAAAKNWQAVAVVSSPVQYAPVLEELRRGGLGDATRRRLAAEAFRRVTAYDAAIAAYFDGLEGGAGDLPPVLTLALDKTVDLRYGENPHQKAAFYRDLRTPGAPLANYVLLQGKALSFNNIADMDAAWALAGEFSTPAIAIIKHASPCGVGCDASLAEAYRKAKEGDPVSAFGGVVGCNRPVDAATAREIAALFTEVVIAPGYEAGALEVFRGKPNLRLVEVPGAAPLPRWEARSVAGGFLVQERDLLDLDEAALRMVTKRAPTDAEMADLCFAWRVAKWVKSNAIVFGKDGMAVGIGTGQPSRVDAVRIAATKAGTRAAGACMASDAFFPFPDGVEVAGDAGVTAVIQPGGSVKDREVIAAADARGMAMVLTGVRHFRH